MGAAASSDEGVARRKTGASRGRLAALLMVLAGVLTTSAWAFSSPLGASPDEPAHVTYAYAVATGQAIPGNEEIEWRQLAWLGGNSYAYLLVELPVALTDYLPISCYAHKPDQPAQCPDEEADSTHKASESADDQSGTTQTTAETGTYIIRYPPLYYLGIGLLLRAGLAMNLSGSEVLYFVRIVSGLACLSMLVGAVALLARRARAVAIGAAVALAFTPMAWFLAASVNSSGFETASAILLAAAVVRARLDLATGDRVTRSVAVALPLATVLLAWSRPLSILWAGLLWALLLLPLRRSGWRRRPPLLRLPWWTLLGAAAALLAAAGWFWYSSELHEVQTPSAETWEQLDLWQRAMLVVLRFGNLIQEGVGVLGWLDTPLPTLAVFTWLLAVGVLGGLWALGARAPMGALPVALFLGLAFTASFVHQLVAAYGWQGRYLLPALAAGLVLMTPGADHMVRGSHGERARAVLLSLISIAVAIQLLAVLWNVGRYAYGLTTSIPRMPSAPLSTTGPAWEPPIGIGGIFVLLAIAAVSLAAGALLARRRTTALMGDNGGFAEPPGDVDVISSRRAEEYVP